MRKIYFLCLTVLLICGALKAQTTNFGLGLSPYGGVWIKFTDGNTSDKYLKLDYDGYINGHVYYERQLTGINFMVEGSYAKANFNELETFENREFKGESDDIQIYSAHVYGGQTINKQKRFQFPIYYGIGVDYVDGEPMNQVFLSLSFKARMKFYISNKMAMYGGASYDTGIGGHDDGTSEGDRVGYNSYHVDTGIIFNF